ncbi:hypothetical protein HDU98_001006 [Podochytrium sp. JEL0797]|nr:hypothetical protein HDU98_001006 [Podochytrium sp. JEL0797]
MAIPDACVQLSYRLKECISQGGFVGRLKGTCKDLQDMYEHCQFVEFEAKRVHFHIRAILAHLAAAEPRAEHLAKNGKLSQTHADLLDPTNTHRVKQLRAKLAHFEAYADQSNPALNPFVKEERNDPILPHQMQTFNILYSKLDPSELPNIPLLESRLRTLESTIGTSLPSRRPSRKTPLSTSLADSTTHLSHLLQTLSLKPQDEPTPQLDTLLSSISALHHSQKILAETPAPVTKPTSEWHLVETPSKKKRAKRSEEIFMPPVSSTSSRLHTLHTDLYPLDRTLRDVQKLVQRLESLHPFHTRAALLADAVEGVVRGHQGTVEELDALEGLVGVVEKGVESNRVVCERNWGVFGVRVAELERRLKAGGH